MVGVMRRVTLTLAVVLVACGKPPKTSVDVDTMREASFVKDIQDEPPRGATKPAKPPEPVEDDTPVPAAGPETSAAPPAKGALPEPEITSRKIDRQLEKDKDAGKPPKKPAGHEKITKAECTRMFDHFFDLILESDERFKDLGADGKSMARQISRQDPQFLALQKDCESDVSRTKFNCAIGARTSAAWQSCVK